MTISIMKIAGVHDHDPQVGPRLFHGERASCYDVEIVTNTFFGYVRIVRAQFRS